MAVRILDVVIDFLDQVFHAAESSPANGLLCDAIKPDLHLIEPGRVGWSEVQVNFGMRRQEVRDWPALVS